MTIQTVVLIETLILLGANVDGLRVIFFTQDPLQLLLLKIFLFLPGKRNRRGVLVVYVKTIIAEGWQPNLILDDGGDLKLIHLKVFPYA